MHGAYDEYSSTFAGTADYRIKKEDGSDYRPLIFSGLSRKLREVSEYSFDSAQNGGVFNDDRAHGTVFGLETDVAVLLVEGLDSCFTLETVNHGNYYFTIVC